jgi:heat shock protein HslJ
VLVANACGGSDDSSAPSAAATRTGATLEGPIWQLEDGSLGAATQGVNVDARFAAGALSGTSGCNTYRTTYRADPPSLTIGPDIATTSKACGARETAVERAYLDRLPKVASYQLDAGRLSLADAEGRALLTYRATDSASALRGGWTATSYYTGDAITSVVGGVDLTITFEATTVSGDGGCNSFQGPYTVDGERIQIGPLAATAKACADPELDAQERDYLAALQLATSYRISGTRLDLLRPGETFAATFERD